MRGWCRKRPGQLISPEFYQTLLIFASALFEWAPCIFWSMSNMPLCWNDGQEVKSSFQTLSTQFVAYGFHTPVQVVILKQHQEPNLPECEGDKM